jgi:molybdenum cofactor cytidylyltransferase
MRKGTRMARLLVADATRPTTGTAGPPDTFSGHVSIWYPTHRMPPTAARRLFAVVPAAGQSRRMGRPKLLLPLGSGTVIGRMLALLQRPDIHATIVVVRPDDEPLHAAVVARGAIPLQPAVAPAEMRHSVEYALQYLQRELQARPDDGWLLAPADHPWLEAAVLNQLIAAWHDSHDRILIPVYGKKRGHPAVLPFRLAAEVFDLPADAGLNQLLKSHAGEIRQIEVNSPGVISDLDTPEDYQRLLKST